MGVAIILAGLICGWLGWSIAKSALKLGRDVATVGVSHSSTAGGMQLLAFALAVPLLLMAMVAVAAGAWDLIESPMKVQEFRDAALRNLEASKLGYEERSARYASNKHLSNPLEQRRTERALAEMKWYASRSREEVIAEADQLIPKTTLASFLDRNIDKRNNEIIYAQTMARAKAKEAALAQNKY